MGKWVFGAGRDEECRGCHRAGQDGGAGRRREKAENVDVKVERAAVRNERRMESCLAVGGRRLAGGRSCCGPRWWRAGPKRGRSERNVFDEPSADTAAVDVGAGEFAETLPPGRPCGSGSRRPRVGGERRARDWQHLRCGGAGIERRSRVQV